MCTILRDLPNEGIPEKCNFLTKKIKVFLEELGASSVIEKKPLLRLTCRKVLFLNEGICSSLHYKFDSMIAIF